VSSNKTTVPYFETSFYRIGTDVIDTTRPDSIIFDLLSLRITEYITTIHNNSVSLSSHHMIGHSFVVVAMQLIGWCFALIVFTTTSHNNIGVTAAAAYTTTISTAQRPKYSTSHRHHSPWMVQLQTQLRREKQGSRMNRIDSTTSPPLGIRQRRLLNNSNLHSNENPNDTTTDSVTVERPDASILLSSQSDIIQQLGIVAITSALGLGTYGVIQLLTLLEQVLPEGWYATWRDSTWPIPFGLIFIAAGIAHFTMKETFTAMVPPKGTWGGLWQVPAPFIEPISASIRPLSYAEYHVYWSGIAEAGGGLLLIVSFMFPNIVPTAIPAFLIFLLLICVTPANIYMATHDVQAPNLPPIPYPSGHIGRGIVQCILLAMFWKLAYP
jgi:uncharacterized membrane protein